METKLVYVLTSTPDKSYCEQALMSIFTARYHNPDAYIVLLVDDKTDTLFTGSRAEILEYINEKIVKELPVEMPMMERSRWLKTSVRSIVDGDFLFVDCDTLITRPLNRIDDFQYSLGAVADSHLAVSQFNSLLYDKVDKLAKTLDWDLSAEEYYYSSGVIYVKDIPENHILFEKWHYYWLEGLKKGVSIDQPSLAKANIEMGRIIKRMNDGWNCVMYTHPLFDNKAFILHFCSFRNMTYAFGNTFLEKVRESGVKKAEFIRYSILHPYETYIPFDNKLYGYSFKDYYNLILRIRKTARLIFNHMDADFDDYIDTRRIEQIVKKIFSSGHFTFGGIIFVFYKVYKIKLSGKYKYVTNTCIVNNL